MVSILFMFSDNLFLLNFNIDFFIEEKSFIYEIKGIFKYIFLSIYFFVYIIIFNKDYN